MKFEEPKVIILTAEERSVAVGPELADNGRWGACCYR